MDRESGSSHANPALNSENFGLSVIAEALRSEHLAPDVAVTSCRQAGGRSVLREPSRPPRHRSLPAEKWASIPVSASLSARSDLRGLAAVVAEHRNNNEAGVAWSKADDLELVKLAHGALADSERALESKRRCWPAGSPLLHRNELDSTASARPDRSVLDPTRGKSSLGRRQATHTTIAVSMAPAELCRFDWLHRQRRFGCSNVESLVESLEADSPGRSASSWATTA